MNTEGAYASGEKRLGYRSQSRRTLKGFFQIRSIPGKCENTLINTESRERFFQSESSRVLLLPCPILNALLSNQLFDACVVTSNFTLLKAQSPVSVSALHAESDLREKSVKPDSCESGKLVKVSNVSIQPHPLDDKKRTENATTARLLMLVLT
jgi:hypothetical protein